MINWAGCSDVAHLVDAVGEEHGRLSDDGICDLLILNRRS